MRKTYITLITVILWVACTAQSYGQDFTFAFFTDMHIHSDSTMHLVQGRLERLSPKIDFVLTGGDNVDIDNLQTKDIPNGKKRMEQLKTVLERQGKPYHVAIGNHDRLPASLRDGHQDFQLFEGVFGKTYYSFQYKGWKFIILNSVQVADKQYTVNEEQVDWLKKVLAETPLTQPLIVVSHVPFLSVYYPVLEGRYTSADTFSNQKYVFDLFNNHDLRLVLQGHMHLYEEIKVKGVPFITAGAVSGNWWNGSFHGTEPGHLEVKITKNTLTWNYIQSLVCNIYNSKDKKEDREVLSWYK